jgi:5'-3' exoribonuclease 2
VFRGLSSSDFPLDLNGAKALWRAVALLPWIEEKRLLTELAKVEPTFTPEEKHRNSLGVDYLFVHKSHLLANSLYALTLSHPAESLAGKSDAELAAEGSKYRMAIDTLESGGMSGYLVPWPGAPEIGSTVESQIGLDPVEDVQALCAIYVDPPHRPHQCALLPGLVPPAPVLVKEDLTEENRGGGGQQGGGGPNGNYNSRNNRQRDSQQGGGRGGYAGNMSTHGGQGPAAQPRFGDAASHFQQNATGNRIWSSGYNQRGGGPDQQQGGRGGAAAGGGGRGGYQGGYGQQQQGGYGNSGYAARGGGFQHQRGGYGGGGRGGYNSPPAQRQYQQQYSPQQYQDQQQQYSPQPPPPSGYSHSRNSGPPAAAAAASNNPFAALAAQAAQALNAHRAMQQQQRRPQ